MNWWELLEHRAWLREHRAKIVSKYFGKGRSFAFDKTGEYVVVVGSAWLLNKGAVDIDVTDDEIYFALLTYLSSSTTENLLKYVSIQVSGGQWDLSNKYLETLPVLDFAKSSTGNVSRYLYERSHCPPETWIETYLSKFSVVELLKYVSRAK